MPRRYRLSLPLWCPQGAEPARHWLSLPLWKIKGGVPSLSPAAPAFNLLSCPLSPRPPSPAGKGETKSLFRRGLRPRHPCIRPFAAFTEPAKQVPAGRLSLGVGGTRRGAEPARHWLSLPLWCPAGEACLPCCPPPLPLVYFSAPYPPAPPSPVGKGGIKVIFMQGAPPLASPAFNRLRHLQSLPNRCQAGGVPPALPARRALAAPGGGVAVRTRHW